MTYYFFEDRQLAAVTKIRILATAAPAHASPERHDTMPESFYRLIAGYTTGFL